MKNLNYLLIALFLTASLACKTAKKDEDAMSESSEIPTTEASTLPSDVNSGDDNVLGDSDNGRAMGLQTVYFQYDSFELSTEARASLDENTTILKNNPAVKIQIEGHCDQRGGIQYNIALGEKRAAALRNYLKMAGIDGSRITTISYGKERPLDPAMNESAFGRNRRGNFTLTAR